MVKREAMTKWSLRWTFSENGNMNLVMLVPLNSSSSVSRTKYFWVAALRSNTDKQSAKANDCNCDLLQQIKLMNFPGNSSMSMLKGKRQRDGGKKRKTKQREKWIQLVITIKTTADVRHEIAKEKGFTQRRRVQNIPAPTSDAKCVFVHGSHAKCKYCIHWCYYCGTFDYSAWINIDHASKTDDYIYGRQCMALMMLLLKGALPPLAHWNCQSVIFSISLHYSADDVGVLFLFCFHWHCL